MIDKRTAESIGYAIGINVASGIAVLAVAGFLAWVFFRSLQGG